MIPGLPELAPVSLIALAMNSAVLAGATIGLFIPSFKRSFAWILAFAAGALISAVMIKLAYQAAQKPDQDLDTSSAWVFIAGGLVFGAVAYFWAARFLDRKGAVVSYPSRFRRYALQLRQIETKELIELLPKCNLLRHMPPEKVGDILPYIQRRYLGPQDILFRAGDPGDALYIVARGTVEVLADDPASPQTGRIAITELGEGSTVGEMALLGGGLRSATVRAVTDTDLLRFDKKDFEQMIAADHELARAAHQLSHERAARNLRTVEHFASTWTNIASKNLGYLSRSEENKMLVRAGHGIAWAVLLGNILDFIPASVVFGSNYARLEIVSSIVMLAIFLAGIPIAAASAEMLQRAGFAPPKIYGIWLVVPLAGMVAAIIAKLFLGGSDSPISAFVEAAAASAALALVAREMIPEAVHQGGSSTVLPLIAGFVLAPFAAAYL
jgi:zinc transporter ZupT